MKSGRFYGLNAPGGPAPLVPSDAWAARHQLLEAGQVGGRQVALAPQEPWLFQGTIRSNILFGLDLRQERYDAVLQACALQLDLQSMPCGDLTEVAAGGTIMSAEEGGSQVARRSRAGNAREWARAPKPSKTSKNGLTP